MCQIVEHVIPCASNLIALPFWNHAERKRHMASHNIMIGNELLDRTVVSEKLNQDIEFLTDRSERLNRQRSPTPTIIKVYQDMLDTRHSVLDWINGQSQPS